MRTNTAARVASTLVGLEGVALLALAGWQIVALSGGDTESAVSALALVVLTVVGGAAVLAFSFAIWRGMSWGRSGGVVTQLMILAVALGAATGGYADPLAGALLAVPAVAGLVAIVVATRRAKPEEV